MNARALSSWLRFWLLTMFAGCISRGALKRHGQPRTITLDGFEPSHAALRRMGMRNEFNFCWQNPVKIRSCQYSNNVVEQDHRRITARVRPMLGFKKLPRTARPHRYRVHAEGSQRSVRSRRMRSVEAATEPTTSPFTASAVSPADFDSGGVRGNWMAGSVFGDKCRASVELSHG